MSTLITKKEAEDLFYKSLLAALFILITFYFLDFIDFQAVKDFMLYSLVLHLIYQKFACWLFEGNKQEEKMLEDANKKNGKLTPFGGGSSC